MHDMDMMREGGGGILQISLAFVRAFKALIEGLNTITTSTDFCTLQIASQ